jgi:hypothetical protein
MPVGDNTGLLLDRSIVNVTLPSTPSTLKQIN